MNTRWLLWFGGFAALLAVEIVVEFALFPAIGLDDTPRNDIWFQAWWVVVGLWLVFGLKVVGRLMGTDPDVPSSD